MMTSTDRNEMDEHTRTLAKVFDDLAGQEQEIAQLRVRLAVFEAEHSVRYEQARTEERLRDGQRAEWARLAARAQGR